MCGVAGTWRGIDVAVKVIIFQDKAIGGEKLQVTAAQLPGKRRPDPALELTEAYPRPSSNVRAPAMWQPRLAAPREMRAVAEADGPALCKRQDTMDCLHVQM
jgi:hypothetical protein